MTPERSENPANPEARFISAPVPFIQIGNRRGLTAMQLRQDPELMVFYKRWQHCFEPMMEADVVLFIEPE